MEASLVKVDLIGAVSTLPAVRYSRLAIAPFLIFLIGCATLGCASLRGRSSAGEQPASFAPVAMRIHPIFTRIEDWTGDNYPDGIDALLEFQDQLGDATKATGRVVFELYNYQKFDPERRGKRLANPWIGSLETVEDQRLRWNRTSRTYSFPLAFDGINANGTYVLTAQFQLSNGGRYYNQIILEPPQGAYAPKGAQFDRTSISEPIAPSSAPSTQPTSAP